MTVTYLYILFIVLHVKMSVSKTVTIMVSAVLLLGLPLIFIIAGYCVSLSAKLSGPEDPLYDLRNWLIACASADVLVILVGSLFHVEHMNENKKLIITIIVFHGCTQIVMNIAGIVITNSYYTNNEITSLGESLVGMASMYIIFNFVNNLIIIPICMFCLFKNNKYTFSESESREVVA